MCFVVFFVCLYCVCFCIYCVLCIRECMFLCWWCLSKWIVVSVCLIFICVCLKSVLFLWMDWLMIMCFCLWWCSCCFLRVWVWRSRFGCILIFREEAWRLDWGFMILCSMCCCLYICCVWDRWVVWGCCCLWWVNWVKGEVYRIRAWCCINRAEGFRGRRAILLFMCKRYWMFVRSLFRFIWNILSKILIWLVWFWSVICLWFLKTLRSLDLLMKLSKFDSRRRFWFLENSFCFYFRVV